MRIHTGRIGSALLACAILVLLSGSGAGGVSSTTQDAGARSESRASDTTAAITTGQKPVDQRASHRNAVGEVMRAPAETGTTAEAQAPSVHETVETGAPDMVDGQGASPSASAAPGAEHGVAPGEVEHEVAPGAAEREEAPPNTPVVKQTSVTPPPASPGDVRALYVTGWTAGSPRMSELIDTMEATGLNAVVIELKGEDGVVSYPTRVPLARSIGAHSRKISDLAALVDRLHAKGFYVIGRMVAFQDGLLSEVHPRWALRRIADGSVWHDAGGLAWVNPDSPAVRSYLHTLAVEAAHAGVDEIQWDYVRFPSDGDMSVVAFTNTRPKAEVITSFLRASREKLHKAGAAVSADLFGFAAVTTTDVGIGQRLEPVVDAVDYTSLMVYPSHFSAGSMGIAVPDRAPGVTVYESMRRAVERTPLAKHRPWLQAFTLRSVYSEQEVAAQVAALYSLGIRSWILWNASNRYKGMIPSASQVAESVDAMGRRIAEGVLKNEGMGGLEPVVVAQARAASAGLKLETPKIQTPARVAPVPRPLDLRLVR